MLKPEIPIQDSIVVFRKHWESWTYEKVLLKGINGKYSLVPFIMFAATDESLPFKCL